MVSLSDAVFALAIAILLISSNVPTDFDELLTFVHDVPTFGICIIFIYWIWNQQNLIFQSYNLFDTTMNLLNMLLLFFVLVYVYPLKFLMKWIFFLFGALFTGSIEANFAELNAMIPMEKVPLLMVIYSIGFICIFICLYLMQKYGLSRKEELGLSQHELLYSNLSKNNLLHAILIGVLSLAIALFGVFLESPIWSFFSGIVYNLLWISSIFNVKKYKQQLAILDLKE